MIDNLKEMIKEDINEISKHIVVKVSREIRTYISHVGHINSMPLSTIMRKVLEQFSIENEPNSNFVKSREEYPITIHIREKDDFTKKDYQDYADTISNEDIIRIVRELYFNSNGMM